MLLKWRYPDKPIETTPDFIGGLAEREWLAQGKYDGWRMSIYSDENRQAHLFSSTRPMILEHIA